MLILTVVLNACETNWDDNPCLESKNNALERLWMIKMVSDSSMTKANAPMDKTWWPGQIIKIKFLNGSVGIQNKVKDYAEIWLEHAGLKFEYVKPEEYADVKVGFDINSNYIAFSTVGTDCKAIPQNEPSLNFVWLEDETDESTIKGEVLRAFGLVLGLTYEHQNPKSPVQIKAAADIALEYGITEEEAEMIKKQYTTEYTNYSNYDKSSIMVLDIPRTLLVDPKQYASANKELSQNDIDFVRNLYPGPKSRNVMLGVLPIVSGVGRYIKGWMHVRTQDNRVLAEVNIPYWSNDTKTTQLSIKEGDMIYIEYEFYFSSDGVNVLKGYDAVPQYVDQGVPYPRTESSTGRCAASGEPIIVTKFNTRLLISFLSMGKLQ